MRARHATAVIALGLLVGCVGTPVPQPPAHQPPDPTELRLDTVGTSVPELVGDPGAAEPGTTLWVVPLDQPLDPVTALVEPDGSFRTGLAVFDGEEIRLQVRSDAGRSRPIDIRLPIFGEIVRPTEDCLRIPAELELPEVAVGTPEDGALLIENVCLEDAVIDAATLRRAAPVWALGSTPLRVPAEGTAALAVRLTPEAPGLTEEILFLEVSAPAADRRPVTLIGRGR